MFVETDNLRVVGSHHQHDLRATELDEQSLALGHQLSNDTATAVSIVYGEVGHPAAMSVIPDHGGAKDVAGVFDHEKQVGLHGELALDVLVRIIPGTSQATRLPERDDGFGVGAIECANHAVGRAKSSVRTVKTWRTSFSCVRVSTRSMVLPRSGRDLDAVTDSTV